FRGQCPRACAGRYDSAAPADWDRQPDPAWERNERRHAEEPRPAAAPWRPALRERPRIAAAGRLGDRCRGKPERTRRRRWAHELTPARRTQPGWHDQSARILPVAPRGFHPAEHEPCVLDPTACRTP